MTQALVTGSDGFIGRNLVKKLEELNIKLVCVDKDPKTHHSWKLDVASKKFLAYFQYQKFDFIFHLGSPCSILQFNEDPQQCVDNTLKGFWNVVYLAENCKAKLIYPSSGNVYGSSDKYHKETDDPAPNNLYGRCKLWCELWAQYSSADTLGLRIFCGYGSGEEMKGYLGSVIYQFLSKMLEGSSPIIWGDGLQMRDFIHVDDIIDGLIKSMNVEGHKILNLASGYPYNYNYIVTSINQILGTDLDPKYVGKPKDYVNQAKADITLMRSALGLDPKPVYQGLRRFAYYLIKQKGF